MKKGVCKLFLEERELITQSHLVPDFVRRDLMQEIEYLLQVSNQPGKPKKIQTSVFDKYILSAEAEQKFSSWETYARKLFIETRPQESVLFANGEKFSVFQFDNVDYDKLKLFIISVLWRCSISERDEVTSVNLGQKYEELARSILISGVAPEYGTFDITIEKFVLNKHPAFTDPGGKIIKTLLYPYPSRIEGVRVYNIYLAGYKIVINCDNRSFPSALEMLTLKRNLPLLILERDFYTSDEYRAMREMVGKNRKPQNS